MGAGSDVAVRPAVTTDVPGVAEISMSVQRLHANAHPERFVEPDARHIEAFFTDQLDQDDAHLLVAELADGAIAGYALAVLRDRPAGPFLKARRTLSLEHLAVPEAAQGRGVGGALIAAARSLARQLGADDIDLVVWAFNHHAIAVYEHEGFRLLRHSMAVDL
jgi:GNAT superfamily N-acetyltransferase